MTYLRILSFGLGIILAFGGYRYYVLNKQYQTNKTENEKTIADLNTNIASLDIEKTGLTGELAAERNKNNELQKQIEDVSGTVRILTKLTETDPELLIKYSKIYFLNENYNPRGLTDISQEYLFDPKKPQKFLTDAWPFFKRLLDDAKGNGLKLQVASSYRSFGTQAALKTGYTVSYGAGTANQFSADQGYSEHQLGTAVDFTTPTVGGALTGFENSPEYKWLADNAYKYGFILSYPKGNSYYQYEPWHWRFVGVELAITLHKHGQNFYDLDQHVIDEFLIGIFNN